MSADNGKIFREGFGRGSMGTGLGCVVLCGRYATGTVAAPSTVWVAVLSPGLQLAKILQQWKLQRTHGNRSEMGSVPQCKENTGEKNKGQGGGRLTRG